MSKLSNETVMPSNRFDSVEKNLVFLRHLAEYSFAKAYVKDKTVLEVGCGTGYGAHYMSKPAREVVAVDISNDAIQYSKGQYNEANLCFKELSGSELPFDDSSFDTVVSLHVIEHIEKNKVTHWLSEINRVLKDEGIFIVSTPNKKLRLYLYKNLGM
jgi:2-polyprenyl-3-methyl-5-hydroxy-6-metoxy-1,4-benzoquinol methylase